MTARRTIALTYNDDFYLYRFKGGLIRALAAAGDKVYAIAPAGRSVEAIEDAGATFIHWPLSRRGGSPSGGARSVIALRNIYARIHPDLVHHFTAKPNIYGAIAARLARVPVAIASVNGLGYVFTERGFSAGLLRPVVSLLYRLAFGLSEAVVFQNHDDISILETSGLVKEEKVRYIAGGSGVDTTLFSPDSVDAADRGRLRNSLRIPENTPVILMVSRMLWHKGVGEFAKCGRNLGQSRQACSLLVGPVDEGNPAFISPEQLEDWQGSGWVRYLGERSDIRELIAISDVVVLPSYREGLPRVLLEAASMGKALVTTDVPGCRDVVDDGINGFVVPARDAGALASAVDRLLTTPSLRAQMGEASRRKALEEFDEGQVVNRVLRLYDELLAGKASG